MMQPQCDWQPGYVDRLGRQSCRCRRCGNQLPQANPARCDARCKVRCARLGNPTGESVWVECMTCKGTKTTSHYKIHQCGLFGECLPAYRCTKDAIAESMTTTIAVCSGCEHFTPQEKP